MPDKISLALDKKAPTIKRRIATIKTLSALGWKIGLRFDPLIFGDSWKDQYQDLHENIFNVINISSIHSISYGPLRFPIAMYKKINSMYQNEKLFVGPFEQNQSEVSYKQEIEEEMTEFCKNISLNFAPESLIFNCKSN